MSRKEENGNVATLVTSELCSNSLPSWLPGDGKVECWPRDMRKIPAAKAGNMAIPFQSEFNIRCQKTKWGSCSDKKNINLNINIAYLPKELQDYILLHELCHTKIKNHSKQFWASLDSYVGGRAKEMSKELRTWRMTTLLMMVA